MKRFLLFTFDFYYPEGGWHDFAGAFDSVEEAIAFLPQTYGYLYHIVDTNDMLTIDADQKKER